MKRLATFVVCTVVACGDQRARTPCEQVPTPAECKQACDPLPGAPNTCPAGFHCSPDGLCTAQCTAGGNQCGDNYVCTPDGSCESKDNGSHDAGPDAPCPAVHFAPTRITPSVELVLDRSYSMRDTFGTKSRYEVMHEALTGAMGAVTTAQANVYFGAALYAGDQTPCLKLAGYTVPRALNNATAIDTLIGTFTPDGHTPTSKAVALVAADFSAHPPPAGSPPIILLATDGIPTDGDSTNPCSADVKDDGPSIAAVAAAYTAGIRTFIIGIAGLKTQFLQDIANVGAGKPSGQTPNCSGCAPYYTADDPASLAAAFNSIINGVVTCELSITGTVDPTAAVHGSVTLNGVLLTYGTDWTVDPNGKTIHLVGAACSTLKASPNPVVDAAFPCEAVLL